jgi:hypothetical protein
MGLFIAPKLVRQLQSTICLLNALGMLFAQSTFWDSWGLTTKYADMSQQTQLALALGAPTAVSLSALFCAIGRDGALADKDVARITSCTSFTYVAILVYLMNTTHAAFFNPTIVYSFLALMAYFGVCEHVALSAGGEGSTSTKKKKATKAKSSTKKASYQKVETPTRKSSRKKSTKK